MSDQLCLFLRFESEKININTNTNFSWRVDISRTPCIFIWIYLCDIDGALVSRMLRIFSVNFAGSQLNRRKWRILNLRKTLSKNFFVGIPSTSFKVKSMDAISPILDHLTFIHDIVFKFNFVNWTFLFPCKILLQRRNEGMMIEESRKPEGCQKSSWYPTIEELDSPYQSVNISFQGCFWQKTNTQPWHRNSPSNRGSDWSEIWTKA